MSARSVRHVARQLLAAAVLVGLATPAGAQAAHDHTPAVSGVPQGIPYFCASPTATSIGSGAWSNPAVWANGHVPGAAERVRIAPGHVVVYDVTYGATRDATRDATHDVASDAASQIAVTAARNPPAVSGPRLDCVDIRGRLTFKTDASTRMTVANLTVMEDGVLEVGTVDHPVAAGVTADIVIADQPIDPRIDPAQIGTGIQGLGRVRMHGAIKAPTFVRLAAEPRAGDTDLQLGESVSGWAAGDEVVIPDTRQLRASERGVAFESRDERVRIATVAGTGVTLQSPLKYDHLGARVPGDAAVWLPHVGNVTRNVVIRSENPSGTRGHTIFVSRADVDLRYVEVRDMGRTAMGPLDNTVFDDRGGVVKLGENQIGRYAIHFHHDFGPRTAPANGYQFTLVGNAVDGAPKWGVTVHNSHYGLIRDNVVYDTGGAGIVTEDGNEAFNVFDHNFALRVRGSGEFAPRSGYGGAAPDPGGEGAAFWFRGPHNYIRHNVGANADAVGFGLAPGALGTVRIPAFKGADPTDDSQTVALDTTRSPVLEFVDNEAYGAMQAGAAWGWNGDVTAFRVWHASRQGVTATPTDSLVVTRVAVRGDPSVLDDALENPVGVWFSNYASKSVVVRDADVQGMRVGVGTPFYPGHPLVEPGRGDGSVVVENGYFRDYFGVVVATGYAGDAESAQIAKHAVVRNAVFAPLDVPVNAAGPPAAVSMNYRMAPGDTERRDPIAVVNYNSTPGDDFNVFYSLEAPPDVAPCHDTRRDIAGWVCR